MILMAAIISENFSEVDTFKEPKHAAIQDVVMAVAVKDFKQQEHIGDRTNYDRNGGWNDDPKRICLAYLRSVREIEGPPCINTARQSHQYRDRTKSATYYRRDPAQKLDRSRF